MVTVLSKLSIGNSSNDLVCSSHFESELDMWCN